MLFIACFISIRYKETEKTKVFVLAIIIGRSAKSTRFFTTEFHVIDVIAFRAMSLFAPSWTIFVVIRTVSSGFAFST